MLELVHTGAGRIDEDSLAVLQSRGGNRDGVEGRGAWLGLLRSGEFDQRRHGLGLLAHVGRVVKLAHGRGTLRVGGAASCHGGRGRGRG